MQDIFCGLVKSSGSENWLRYRNWMREGSWVCTEQAALSLLIIHPWLFWLDRLNSTFVVTHLSCPWGWSVLLTISTVFCVGKVPSSQSYGFSSSHVWTWELDYKEGRVPKNWCFWTVVLEKTLESSLDSKEIKQVNPKGNQLWASVGRTDAKAEAPFFGHLMASLEKTLMLEKTRQEEKGTTEDEMVG